MRQPLRRLLLIAAVLAAAGASLGCGEREEVLRPEATVELTVALGGEATASHAPLYAAEDAGRFEALGLAVRIEPASDGRAALRELDEGRADLALVEEPAVFSARAGGSPAIAVAAVVQSPLAAIVSLRDAGIDAPEALRGTRLGSDGSELEEAYVDTVLARAGVEPSSVKRPRVEGDPLAALAEDRADAVLAERNRAAADLRPDGQTAAVIPVEDAGVPEHDGLVLAASDTALDDEEDVVRSFVAALEDGTADLERDPAGAVRGLVAANPRLELEAARASVEATLPLLSAPAGRPYGWLEPGEWEAFGAFLAEARVLAEAPPAGAAFTNELLPGEGLR